MAHLVIENAGEGTGATFQLNGDAENCRVFVVGDPGRPDKLLFVGSSFKVTSRIKRQEAAYNLTYDHVVDWEGLAR